MLFTDILLPGAACFTLMLLIHLYWQPGDRRNERFMSCMPPRMLPFHWFGIKDFWWLYQAAKEKRWIDYIAFNHDLHGHTFGFSMLNQDIICTIEPENVKAILATQFSEFGLGLRKKQFHPLLGEGIFTMEGVCWAQVRARLRPQFTATQVWLHSGVFNMADVNMFADRVTEMMRSIPRDGSCFDIQKLFFKLTLNSAADFLFGESIDISNSQSSEKSTSTDFQKFGEAFDLAQDYLAARSRAQGFYWLINPKDFQDAIHVVHQVIDEYVQRAILWTDGSSCNKNLGNRYNFLDALAADTQDPKVLRDNVLNLLLAGRDTTASLLSSTFYFLARHPNVWRKLRLEVLKQFGDRSKPMSEITRDKLKDLTYLRYVVNEGEFLPVPFLSKRDVAY
ncbi:hypothetical protein N7462_009711 [Penicillium macrosclerotiorum]|uniref:uncharacterized protein n=1 Tax=Penicillium macrosclerotiorum TaxID=303699 RepID=UPI00254766C6|nr:uncharacterized protein N7462_009711 [Penicillium macrosclerotiorum]KAJ5674272.1 hypothetical protein N7462_009711 [Penicillium macrosclerotiorum]